MTRLRLDGDKLEFLDQPNLDPRELRTCFADVERLNRWFGGTRAVVAEVRRIASQRGLKGRISVLDVGAGGADIPRALVRWGRRHGADLRIVACDRHEQITGVAAAFCSGAASISILRTDALALPFRPGDFDFVTCSLMLHHLKEEDVVALLEKLRGLPRRALIVSDLERSGWAYIGTWLGTHLLCRSPFTRHDGPASVRRAYTLDELCAFSRRAGCGNMRWSRRWSFRVVGVLEN
jgi:2-polyprenyl-3-methyl-5-hydroxy-6-metoxy-1,4-benzoquinol methylase